MHQRRRNVGATDGAQSPNVSTYSSYYGSPSPGYGAAQQQQQQQQQYAYSSQSPRDSNIRSNMIYSNQSTSQKKRRNPDNSHYNFALVICLVLVIVVSWISAGIWIIRSGNVNQRLSKEMHDKAQEFQRDLRRQLDNSRKHEDQSRTATAKMERSMREMQTMQAKSNDELAAAKEESNKIETALRERIEKMKIKISEESKRDALEKFGEGPHRVQMEVHGTDYKGHFTILMHPLDVMPHSVHLFLEQVVHGLWDGCAFVINAPHLLQAGAHPADVPSSQKDDSKLDRFKMKSLDTLSFQEFNDNYPHDKWTVGFAGRPAGPDFYINKVDNIVAHGPHGQKQHDLQEEADPCFARVIDGFDILEKLFNSPVDASYDLMNPIVRIHKAVLLDYNPPRAQNPDYHYPPPTDPNQFVEVKVRPGPNQNQDIKIPPHSNENPDIRIPLPNGQQRDAQVPPHHKHNPDIRVPPQNPNERMAPPLHQGTK